MKTNIPPILKTRMASRSSDFDSYLEAAQNANALRLQRQRSRARIGDLHRSGTSDRGASVAPERAANPVFRDALQSMGWASFWGSGRSRDGCHEGRVLFAAGFVAGRRSSSFVGMRSLSAVAALVSIWSDSSRSSTARAMVMAPTRRLSVTMASAFCGLVVGAVDEVTDDGEAFFDLTGVAGSGRRAVSGHVGGDAGQAAAGFGVIPMPWAEVAVDQSGQSRSPAQSARSHGPLAALAQSSLGGLADKLLSGVEVTVEAAMGQSGCAHEIGDGQACDAVTADPCRRDVEDAVVASCLRQLRRAHLDPPGFLRCS